MRALLKLLAVAGTLALASCGGSDDDDSDKDQATTSTATTAVVTRASYIAEADAFCKKSNAQAKNLNERAQDAVKDQPDDIAILTALAPLLKQGLAAQVARTKEFAAIPSPPGDSATVDRLKGAFSQRNTLLRMLADAAAQRDVKQFSSITAQQARLTKRVQRITRAYGLKECGSRKNEADPAPAAGQAGRTD